MRLGCNFALILALAALARASETGPLAHWSFDDPGASAREDVTGTNDAILGFHDEVPGVSKLALRFDGYTTHIVRSGAKAPDPSQGLTVETWVVLDAYPWNWVPVVDYELDQQEGYLFGIDAYGHVGLQAAIGGVWQVVVSTSIVPLKRWTHVACTFQPDRGIRLYVNGKPSGELAIRGHLAVPEHRDLIIGAVRRAMLPVPSDSIHPKDPVWYSLEGSLDELTIYGRGVSSQEINSAFAMHLRPMMPSSPWGELPSGPPGMGNFGAYYTTLKFQETWDRLRRIGPNSDVIVRFDQSPIRLVFWQGTSYVPAWVTENNKWYTDEFLEAYGKPNCPDGEDCEPMSDKQDRYSHVRILESTNARAVVHWRYALSETRNYKGSYADPTTGWFDWADEYWTVYPDGVAIRKQVLWSSNLDPAKHEFQETIVLNGPGQRPEDNINFDALVLGNMKGETASYSWAPKTGNTFDYPHGPKDFLKPEAANIQWVNLKSSWKPFQIVPGDPVRLTAYNGEKTYSAFEWWNHWPVAQIPSSGRPALAPDRPSHTSLSHIYWPAQKRTAQTLTKLLMDGLTTKTAAELAPLAKSWLRPAPIEVTGLRSLGYDAAQRAYVFVRDAGFAATITLHGSPDSPIVNPALVIRDWDANGRVRVRINGRPASPNTIRQGKVAGLTGTEFVLWIELQSNEPVRIEVEASS